eukprot:150597_1
MIHSPFDRIIWIYITCTLILLLQMFMILSQYFESNTIFILGLRSYWSLEIFQNGIQSQKMYLQVGNNIFSIYKHTKTTINSIYYVRKKLNFNKKMMEKNEKYKI